MTKRVMSLSDRVCVGSLSRDWCRFVSIAACAKGRVLCRVCPLPVVCAQKKTASGDSASCVARTTHRQRNAYTRMRHMATHTRTRGPGRRKHTGWVVGVLQMKLCSGPAAAYSSAGGSSGAFFVGFAGGLERVGLG